MTRRRERFTRCSPYLAAAALLLAGCCDERCPTADAMPRDAALDAEGDAEGGCVDPPEGGADRGDAAEDALFDGHGELGSPDLEAGSFYCPPCMVLVNGLFCIDRYEASRADATSTSQGFSTEAPICRAGVLPWYTTTLTRAEAADACAKAGKRICSVQEWKLACAGPQNHVYGYGDVYDPVICNGIDRFCYCGGGQACEDVSPCPYAHCYNAAPPGDPGHAPCGSYPHEVPTGSHLGCVNGWGLYDMNGNVWEVAEGGDGQDHFRGGAFNCIDSEKLHRCDYDITGGIWARGFRCCKEPQTVPQG